MDTRSTHDSFTVTGHIEGRTHDVGTLREKVGNWDDLAKRQKALVTRPPETIDMGSVDEEDREYAQMWVEPTERVEEYNTTCVGLHEYMVDTLDAGQAVDRDASHLALGNDASVTPASSDTALTNEVYRETVTDHADNGTSLLCSTFVDSNEANGYGLEELGLFTSSSTGSNILLNHSTFATVTKDNTKTVTFDVTLTFSAA